MEVYGGKSVGIGRLLRYLSRGNFNSIFFLLNSRKLRDIVSGIGKQRLWILPLRRITKILSLTQKVGSNKNFGIIKEAGKKIPL